MRRPYNTLKEALYYEAETVKGSRFYVNAVPVTTEGEAKEALERAHAQFPHARHHCWAMVLREPDISRPNDDGEPSGSAGKPILAQIQGRDLVDVIIIISRFFGGTKLGVGGLVRAYGGSAGQALDHAETITITPKTTVRIHFSYAETATVESALATLEVTPSGAQYLEEVELSVEIEDAEVASFIHRFKDHTAHRIKVEQIGE